MHVYYHIKYGYCLKSWVNNQYALHCNYNHYRVTIEQLL
jgi:hypothetical protein